MRRITALLLAGGILATGGCSSGGDESVAQPVEEPSHEVTYVVTTTGSANGNMKIGYTGADGGDVEATSAGSVPMWTTTVTTEPGISSLALSGSANSSDLSFQLQCAVLVDKVQVASHADPYGCSTTFELSNLKAVLASKSPSAPPTSASSPSSPPVRATPPGGCRFVEEAEVTQIVNELAGVLKPVQYTKGDADSCTYGIDYDATRVTVTWRAGGKIDQTYGSPKLSGLGATAYWSDFATFGILDAQLSKGAFNVRVTATMLNIDKRKLAIAVFKAAKPRLPD